MRMQRYCPIIKGPCKAEACMAWREDGCSIFSFLERFTLTDVPPGRVAREQIVEDERKAQQLLEECLEWAKSNKIIRPTREDINTFLNVKNTVLCEPAMRFLWRQVKAKLRESRKEMAQMASQNWRDNTSNAGLAWSSDEDKALAREFDSGKRISELAQIHKRSLRAIELRLEKLGRIQLPR